MCLPLDKCCFCISLKVGTIIIAVLSLINYTLVLAVYGTAAVALPSLPHSKQNFYIFTATIAASQVICSSLLIYGALLRKTSCLWPWLVTSWVCCGGLVLLSVTGVVLLALQHYDDVETSVDINTMSSFYFVYAVILYYCTTIVNSRRVQMTREEEIESAESLMRERDIPKSLLVQRSSQKC